MGENPCIRQVFLTSLEGGLVEFDRDWVGESEPIFSLEPGGRVSGVEKLPPHLFGFGSGYFFENGRIRFVLDPEHYPWPGLNEHRILVGGEFNDWNPLAEPEKWQLVETLVGDRVVPSVSFANDPVFSGGRRQFKFMVAPDRWLSPPDEAPNRVGNELWNANLEIDPARTGHHRFLFEVEEPVDLSEEIFLKLAGSGGEGCLVRPGDFFYGMGTEQPLGAIVGEKETVFRVFAPRARRVEVLFFEDLNRPESGTRIGMEKGGDGSWSVEVPRRLDGWFYWYYLDGASNASLYFSAGQPVADPWALALVGREGPGIVIDKSGLERAEPFAVPEWQDLVIAEIHVRDVVAHAPVALEEDERLGFGGLRKWVESDRFHLAELGVNAVELQPVQEFDSERREEYHWGYMPVNFFAPESSYGAVPEKASQLLEFRELVAAFHARGMAVILDVVYNHAGVPNHLLFIDKEYYFELDVSGQLLNWSGCGNDIRPDAVMARRLIIESLVHWVEYFGVDGFRFDLAELLGVDLLREIEERLKEVKPDVILIAEPWSFRGHIGRQLRSTGFASWNDAYRDFMRGFVRGHSSADSVRFFLSGSPGDLAVWPAQTVNYTESHDDRTWIDNITENDGFNGFFPTDTDRRRTHLMVAFLMSSIGIPMISAGQDFMRSKHGVGNTYQRGDLNALDYERLGHFRETHEYFAGWIRFRRSDRGRFFRPSERPTADFLRFFFVEDSAAFAVMINADGSQGEGCLLLAINPYQHPVSVLVDAGEGGWRRLADTDRFDPGGLAWEEWGGGELWLDGLECGLWEKGG